MKTEFLTLWVHFLWSGVFTMMCCIAAWWKVGGTRQPQRSSESTTGRRRLLNIAGMISVCLLLNLLASLSTSVKLKEWSRTTNISLACEIKETWSSRSWDVYGFDNGTIVEVCSAEDSIPIGKFLPCLDSCTWYPGITAMSLVCSSTLYGSLEQQQADDSPKFSPCDCPCGSLIEIQKPR